MIKFIYYILFLFPVVGGAIVSDPKADPQPIVEESAEGDADPTSSPVPKGVHHGNGG